MNTHRMNIGKSKGQVVLEYAVLIACIVAALLAMGVFVKRGISGNMRSSLDEIGAPYDPAAGRKDITIVEKCQPQSADIRGQVEKVSFLEEDISGDQVKEWIVQTTNTIDAQAPVIITRTGTETVGNPPAPVLEPPLAVTIHYVAEYTSEVVFGFTSNYPVTVRAEIYQYVFNPLTKLTELVLIRNITLAGIYYPTRTINNFSWDRRDNSGNFISAGRFQMHLYVTTGYQGYSYEASAEIRF